MQFNESVTQQDKADDINLADFQIVTTRSGDQIGLKTSKNDGVVSLTVACIDRDMEIAIEPHDNSSVNLNLTNVEGATRIKTMPLGKLSCNSLLVRAEGQQVNMKL